MSKITVLMAVYNAEKFLPKSLESLQRQTFQDIQIVCIDDASTDASLDILKDYASRDRRIIVLHLNENHGQAYARNYGLKIADGEYVAMLDADDWLADDSLEEGAKVFERFPKTDCVLFDVRLAYANGKTQGYDWHYCTDGLKVDGDGSFDVMTGKEAFMASLDWGIHGVSMDRARLYRDYPYDMTCRSYSDDNTTRLHYLASREVRCCKGKYFYYQHSSSVSHSIGIGRMDWMKAADSMRTQLEKIGAGENVLRIWEWERWKIIVGCYWFYFIHRKALSADDCRYCISQIRKAWEAVDMQRLHGKPIYKFGWNPFNGHWMLFRLEEEIYFYIRRLIGRR